LPADVVNFKEGDPRQVDPLGPKEVFHPIGTGFVLKERK
jgi:hypothetical protein